jgi:ATP-dependent Lhr-like helicase
MGRRFHDAVVQWFEASFASPTRAQELGWPEIQAGHSTLVFAPTGSGKTLAAFLVALDRLMFTPEPERAARCRVLYVSPLRALAVDVERNLRSPTAGIARAAERLGVPFRIPEVAIRTGDTPQSERAAMGRRPPDILITTPESLFLVLNSQARALLHSVETVIVDEIHALVATKRGAHLALSLERVAELSGRPLQRIGLSATQRPLEEVARFLGGGEPGKTWKPRPVRIVDARGTKVYDLRVEVPVEDMSKLGEVLEVAEGPAAAVPRRSIWPAVHPRLVELIRAHRSTILFVNSRRLAERLAGALNEVAGEELCRAHHGSIAREQRLAIEDALKSGTLRALVATSSLELGIDMGAVDLVIQIETPPSVASGVQRIGRASHQVGAVSRGVLFPKFRGDLLATAAITRAMRAGEVEATRIPRNPLDVLAQQLVAICSAAERDVDELFELVRRAAPYARLSRGSFEGVLDLLAGRYPSDEFAELRPRLVWDRLKGRVRAREGVARLVAANAGTIPDRGLYSVMLRDDGAGRKVGELDEEMVFESREGEVFVLGASSWRIDEITRDRVFVTPAPGQPGKMPFWKADRPPRPVELGARIGALTRELAEADPARAERRLIDEHGLTELAARNLLAYLEEQKQATGALPDDRTLVLERLRDEMGDFRLCLLSPWGGRVHAPWTLALMAKLRAAGQPEVETVWSDDGIVVRFPDGDRVPEAIDLLPEPGEVEELVKAELSSSPLFAATFREAAGRALLLPRRRPGQRTPLWMQRKRAHDLLSVASGHPSFPILLETYRECLQDVFDLPALVDLLSRIQRRELRVVTVDGAVASPFAASLLFGYVANYLYDGDAPLAERRAQALTVDPEQLRELLGEAELRELIDPAVLAELEAQLQALDPTRHARGADGLHDLLLRLGPLTAAEIAARCSGDAEPWLAALLAERRGFVARLAGEERVAAVEDAGRLRDGLGVALPQGLPRAFLGRVPDALDELLLRHARSHGPFHAASPARRLGLAESVCEAALQRLAAAGRLLEGEFRPGGAGREWCGTDVLASLRRRSLSRLRKQAEPVEPEVLGRFLPAWHGIPPARSRSGPDALLDTIEQLQGAAFPASALERDVLPARIAGYKPSDLDLVCAAGEVVLVGAGPLGERDGRLALYLADDRPLLQAAPAELPGGELHPALLAALQRRGACFFAELQAEVGGLPSGALDALWDLFWAGRVTNDGPGALRSFLGARATARHRPRRLGTFRSRRQAPPAGAGRWSLLPQPSGTPTARLERQARQLLARTGVLTRDAVLAEGLTGGFAALYPVLRALEENGRVRRGYFVRGQGGAQFALPGAVERLRALRETGEGSALVLAATDPANPWGATLAWPRSAAGRAQRAAGCHVVLVEGALGAFLTRDARDVVTFLPDEEPERSQLARGVARALCAWPGLPGNLLGLVDGVSAASGPLAGALREAGFVPAGPGLRRPAMADEGE